MSDLREKVAELCHEQWSGWMKYLFSKTAEDGWRNVSQVIPPWAVERWQRQMETPYASFSDEEKETERKEADKFLKLMKHAYVRVGVAVIITRVEGQHVLMGLRKGVHGAGTWSFPGGHLELGETPAICARREVLEEVGLKITRVRFGSYTNDMFDDGKHYITLYLLADTDGSVGEVVPKEPTKCERWSWVDWHSLPSPLFKPVRNLIRGGFSPRSRG